MPHAGDPGPCGEEGWFWNSFFFFSPATGDSPDSATIRSHRVSGNWLNLTITNKSEKEIFPIPPCHESLMYHDVNAFKITIPLTDGRPGRLAWASWRPPRFKARGPQTRRTPQAQLQAQPQPSGRLPEVYFCPGLAACRTWVGTLTTLGVLFLP